MKRHLRTALLLACYGMAIFEGCYREQYAHASFLLLLIVLAKLNTPSGAE